MADTRKEIERDSVLLWLQAAAPTGHVTNAELAASYDRFVRDVGAPAVANTTALGRFLAQLGQERWRRGTERGWEISRPDVFEYASRPLRAVVALVPLLSPGTWTPAELVTAYSGVVADEKVPRLPDGLVRYALRGLLSSRSDVEVSW